MHGNMEYLSYPFLYENKKIVDFELITDEIASYLALAMSVCEDETLKNELEKIATLVYHLNPCIRQDSRLEGYEIAWLYSRYNHYKENTKDRPTLFVLPAGSTLASVLHILRCKSKQLVRLLHHIYESKVKIDDSIFDFTNVMANYFFVVALYANKLEGVQEIPFVSRVY
jgi:ATP:cob(I)alamin adenosyltransferase